MKNWRVVLFTLFSLSLSLSGWHLHAQDSNTNYTNTISNDKPFVEIPFVLSEARKITVDVQVTSGDLDTLIYILDATGKILIENDDRALDDKSSRVADFRLPVGTYTVVVTRYGVKDGDTEGDFVATIEDAVATTPALQFATRDEDLLQRGFPDIAPKDKADWTILAYFGGDTNLEASILNDLDELERAGGSDKTVRVIALIDRSPAYSEADGNWSSARVYEIGADVSKDAGVNYPPTVDSVPLADLGAVDSGRGELLAQFLTWGVQAYPADHYVVNIGGHGGGWAGLVADDTSQSVIPLDELTKAFQVATQAAGVAKFDLLVNDACLMASIEYFSAVDDYFHQSIASPEIVMNPALDLKRLTDEIRAEPIRTNTVRIGQTVVDTYLQQVSSDASSSTPYLSLVMTDLDQFQAVTDATEAFATLINQDSQKYNALIGLAYINAYKMATYMGEDDKLDLGHFMQQVIALTNDADVIAKAQAVVSALNTVRLYANANDYARLYTSYYNIYFPKESRLLDPRYFQESPLVAWQQMLVNYFNEISPRLWLASDSAFAYHPPVKPDVRVTSVYPTTSSIAFPPTISLQVVGHDISDGEFTVDYRQADGSTVRLLATSILTEVQFGDRTDTLNNWKSGIDLSYFSWLPLTLPTLSDGTNTYNELVLKTNESVTLNGRYRQDSNDIWHDVILLFNEDGSVRQAVTRNALGTFAPTTIPTGADFQAYRYVVEANGNVKATPGNTYEWGRLRYQEDVPPSGNYELGFLIKTFGGTSGFASTTVTLDNSQQNPDLRGYSDVDLGFAFQHPANWALPTTIDDYLITQSPDDPSQIRVFNFSAINNLYDILDKFLNDHAYTLVGSAQTITLANQSALRFDYRYSDDANADIPEWRGQGVVFFRQTADGGTALIFVAQAPENRPELLDPAFSTLVNNLQFFDAQQIAQSNTSTWDYGFLPRNLAYPTPKNWAFSADSASGAIIYTSPDDVTGVTTASISAFDATDTAKILDQLLAQRPDAQDINKRTYYGEHHVWDSAYYHDTVAGQAMIGRIYVTRLDDRAYAWRFQVPDSDSAYQVIRDTFEPMVDGFAPPLTVTLSTNDIQPALLKAALVASQQTCKDLEVNHYCVGNGTVVGVMQDTPVAKVEQFAKPVPVLYTPAPASALGDTQPLQDLVRLDVGLLDDGTIDPLSIGILNIDQLQMITFGGVSLTNLSALKAGEIVETTLTNVTGQRINVRQYPDLGSLVVDGIDADQTVTVVARLQDSSWLRVKTAQNRIGWVNRELLSDSPDRDKVPVNDALKPYYASMQDLELTLNGDLTDPSLLKGVFISVPQNVPNVHIAINDTDFEFAAGSVLFWQASTDALTEVNLDANAQGEVGLIAKRRPGTWSLSVLKGAVRAKRIDLPNAPTITAIAGTSIQLGFDGLPKLGFFSPFNFALGDTLLSSVPQPLTQIPLLTIDEFYQLVDIQYALNDNDLNDVYELQYNYMVDTPEDPGVYLEENTDAVVELSAPPEEAPSVPSDPSLTANLCDVGQVWGDGRCDDPDPAVREYLYEAGFYVKQYEIGNLTIDQIPAQFADLVNPPLPTPVATSVVSVVAPIINFMAPSLVCSLALGTVGPIGGNYSTSDGATIVNVNTLSGNPAVNVTFSVVGTGLNTFDESATCAVGAPIGPLTVNVQVSDSLGRTYIQGITLDIQP